MAIINSSAFSFGAGNFGSYAFGDDVIPIVIALSSTVTSAGVRVVDASASTSVASTVSAIGGFTANVAATTAATSAVAATAKRIREASATSAAAASTQSNATATFVSGAVSSATTVTASIGEQFVLKESSMYSYGTSTWSGHAYGIDDLQTVSSATATITATPTRILPASASISASASSTSAATRVRESSGAVTASATITANAVYSIIVAVTISAQSSVPISYVRKRNAGGLFIFQSSSASLAREKWEFEPITTASWSNIASNDVTWTKLAA